MRRPRVTDKTKRAGLFSKLGPGLITGAADDDPSGIATYSQAGARFGFDLLWTMLLTYPLMCGVQLTSARIGRVTGRGLCRNLKEVMPSSVGAVLIALLFIANTINIGADLAAMGEAARLVSGAGGHLWTLGFAAVSLGLQLFVAYPRYARFLKWLTMTLFAYVAVAFMVKLDWNEVLAGLTWPGGLGEPGAAAMIVAILGTTISPYMFFWQSAQEVEEVDSDPDARPLAEAPVQARGEFRRIRIDTFAGMALSNLIALAIMISAAATLHASGVTDIQTAGQAAEALRPAAGDFAFWLFALGIVGTGMLAVPVLAGSAAFAVGELNGWTCGLEYRPWKAPAFYGVITAATLIGVAMDWAPIDPIRALYWSAVVNGVIAVPIMAAMMVVASRRPQMGRFTVPLSLKLFGWLAVAVMAAATAAMAAMWIRGGDGGL
jgi:NRAMP (natural resistance-associated macrophage protein)-like metal ion transporter